MNTANIPNTGDVAHSEAVQAGHWLPALRPDEDQPIHSSISNPSEIQHTADAESIEPPVLPSYDDERLESVSESWVAPVAENDTRYSDLIDEAEPPTTFPASAPQRTLPTEEEEMLDDEDDERLDPSWGFKRMSTAQILATVDHSTSFPSFATPPATEPTSFLAQPEPATRQQEISPPPESLPTPYSNLSDPPIDAVPQTEAHIDEQAGVEEELEDAPIGAVGLDDARDNRFEEGLPLVEHEITDEPVIQDPDKARQESVSGWGDPDEDTSFFSNIKESAPHHTYPPELTRKSTSAVVDSLHVQLKHISEESTSVPNSPVLSETNEAPLADDGLMISAGMDEPKSADVEDMWKAMLADDEDEFLLEDDNDFLPASEPGSPSSFIASLQESGEATQLPPDVQQTPPSAGRPGFDRQSSSNPYAPHQPSTSELTQLSPTTHGSIGFSRPGLEPMNSFQSHLQQRPSVPRAESFADQAKGGYKSPYDLPMELSKPKKRPVLPQLPSSTKPVPPPPRTSSMSDKQLQSPFSPTGPGFPPQASRTSQQPPNIPQQRNYTAAVPAASNAKPKPAPSSFFEELPVITKPRSGSGGHGRFTPQHPQNIPPPQILPQSPPLNRAPLPQPSPPRQADPYAQFQLRAPDRVDPFSNMPLQSAPAPQIPAAQSTRYSPAPPALQAGPRPGPSPRYSPAPPPQASGVPPANRYASQPSTTAPAQPPALLNRTISQPPPSQLPPVPQLPFQPRTSSPLAYHKNSIDGTVAGSVPRPNLPSQYSNSRVISPPTSNIAPSGNQQNFYSSPPKAVAPDGMINTPRRSQTQSPSKQRPRPPIAVTTTEPYARPASAHGQMSPVRAYAHMESMQPPQSNFYAHTEQLDFVQPTDDTLHDPLQRWKGAPVFHFGFGGTLVTTFPKHIPRYSAGAVRPQIKPTLGEVTLKGVRDVIELPEHQTSFPGPLRSKSRKKDLVTWIGTYVAKLESDAPLIFPSRSLPDPRKRHDEKMLLWKVVKSMVEHDGVLDTTADALKSVNQVLTPEIFHLDEATATQYREDLISPSGTYRPAGAALRVDAIDPMAMQTLRKHLQRGARQDAVWYAVDNRLWSHAIIIASTLTRDIWRQVIQEFVKQEVRNAGENAESLSALYDIFGGNVDDCIDQLVPPSARAGLQMVSKIEQGGPTKNALDGLDKWKETLSLVINNRSPGDHNALMALGRLLQDYGRIEAAHICFLFARNPSTPALFGGADDPLTSIVLLGADHKKRPFDFARDHEAILLTEAYEFASLSLSGAANLYMPYLSAYKLQRANLLTDSGFRTEAQSYCDALFATMKSTKAPAYYHAGFLAELDDLSNRLKQVPIQATGSWKAPTIEKVGGSLLSKLSNFVAGDDSDADSKGSGRDAAESGPFAKVSGTPSLSRNNSQSDIYGSYPTQGPVSALPTTIAGSRYAPNGFASARSSSELTRGRPSLDSQRSPPNTSHGNLPRASAYDPINMFQQSQVSPPTNPYQSLSFGASPPSSNYQSTPPQSSYVPNNIPETSPVRNSMPPRQDSYIPTPPPEQPQMVYEPKPTSQAPASDSPAFGGYVAAEQNQFSDLPPQEHQPQDHAYAPPDQPYSYGYNLAADTGYTPYVPEPDSPEEHHPKKKSSTANDDDFRRANSTQAQTADAPTLSADEKTRRTANDAAADAAFKAAAAEDARLAAGKEKAAKGSWFGGWLGGKKTDSLDGSSAPAAAKGAEAKVYRAKLGESKMKLYYDEKLKKWVNPDNPDAAKAVGATPPPPRMGGTPAPGPPMGLPRSVSAAAGLGGPPSKTSSPALGPPTSSPSLGAPQVPSPAMGGSPSLGVPLPASGPPSRAATPASAGSAGSGPTGFAALPPNVNVSLAEGAPVAGLGVGVGSTGLAPPSGPPSRPSTAMSNASSIDDLLGPGAAGMGRKSVKGKKGGRGRYVDVMAK